MASRRSLYLGFAIGVGLAAAALWLTGVVSSWLDTPQPQLSDEVRQVVREVTVGVDTLSSRETVRILEERVRDLQNLTESQRAELVSKSRLILSLRTTVPEAPEPEVRWLPGPERTVPVEVVREVCDPAGLVLSGECSHDVLEIAGEQRVASSWRCLARHEAAGWEVDSGQVQGETVALQGKGVGERRWTRTWHLGAHSQGGVMAGAGISGRRNGVLVGVMLDLDPISLSLTSSDYYEIETVSREADPLRAYLAYVRRW